MKDSVRVAELKSHLSAYLRRVRRGESLTVFDRDTPIARLEPVGTGALVVREPRLDAPEPRHVRLPAPLKTRTDVLRLLADERGER